jgi:hypothetical protein
MTEIKSSSTVDKKNIRNPILESLNYLFYVSKVLGMIPYSLSDYITKKQFKLSQVGGIFGILSCIHYATHYHFLNIQTMIEREDEKSIGTFTTVIIYLVNQKFLIGVSIAFIGKQENFDNEEKF